MRPGLYDIYDGKHHEISELLPDGTWVPAVPLPMFYGPVCRCKCGRWFWHPRGELRVPRYELHYRAVHIEGRPYLKAAA